MYSNRLIKTDYIALTAMLELFEEWFPLGEKISALQQVMGRKPVITEGKAIYVFDDGVASFKIEMILDDEIIQWVIISSE